MFHISIPKGKLINVTCHNYSNIPLIISVVIQLFLFQDIAKRLQAHEERKAAILRQKQQEKDAELARRISQSERPGLPETPGVQSPRTKSIDMSK